MIAMQPAPQATDSAILERWSQSHPYFSSGTDIAGSVQAPQAAAPEAIG